MFFWEPFFIVNVFADCEAGRHGRLNAMAGSFLKKDSRKVRAFTCSVLALNEQIGKEMQSVMCWAFLQILRDFEKYGGSKIANGELRGVPSGPDPLHHHKGSPQRPQTP